MAGFLVDANLPYSSKILLEELGFTASHVREVGLRNAKDEEIFRFAQKDKKIILTRDKDFADAVKFKPGKHQGIIVMRISYLLTATQINRILKGFIQTVEVVKLRKALVILEAGRYRIRKK